jgi:hypothetical protein
MPLLLGGFNVGTEVNRPFRGALTYAAGGAARNSLLAALSATLRKHTNGPYTRWESAKLH